MQYTLKVVTNNRSNNLLSSLFIPILNFYYVFVYTPRVGAGNRSCSRFTTLSSEHLVFWGSNALIP
jgi:hypothetical protein